MRLRDGNIIVCDCGAELNPEITTAQDFITYNNETKIASCANCSASGEIIFSTEETSVQGPTTEERVDALEDAMLFII